ncbi:MAG: nitroreductase family protein [Oscillospiraceae bacterium]
MNETIQGLLERKSVRVFTDESVSNEMKTQLLECAAAAPTAGNQQLYTILDITDQTLKDTLAVTCDNQPFIAKAPVVLIFCADANKWYQGFQHFGCEPRMPGEGDLMLAVCDAVIAAQNVVTAAHSLGLGACYIGDIMERCEEHRAILKLPKYVFPVAMLVVGWPTQQQKDRRKPERQPLSMVVRENAYAPFAKDELARLLEPAAGQEQSVEERFQAFCARKYNSGFSREMTRSVEEYLRDFR